MFETVILFHHKMFHIELAEYNDGPCSEFSEQTSIQILFLDLNPDLIFGLNNKCVHAQIIKRSSMKTCFVQVSKNVLAFF